jgi:putative aldouronate transport system permease protein
MILPAGMIPQFLLIMNLHLIDTLWAIVVPPMFSIWYIILIRTNYQTIPESLIDSAKIDGASDWRVLFQIIIPLSKPIIATIALFAAVHHWNEFFSALIYLNDAKKYPLQMVLRSVLITQEETDMAALNELTIKLGGIMGSGFVEKMKMATVVATIGPIILIYPFAQKYFIKGTLVGSVKG